MRHWLCLPFLLVHFAFSPGAAAQDSARAVDTVQAVDSTLAGALNIIVDCPSCDQNYFKTEIGFVNFVRDRQLADVDILVSRQTTGALGKEYTLEFIGQRNYATMRDTLKYVSRESDSDDNIRQGLVKTIKLGLMRYVSRTSLGNDVNISYEKPAVSTKVKDPWHYWVLSLSANGWTSGQKSTNQFYIYTQLSARRTTEMLKIRLSAYNSYQRNKYDFDDFKFASIARSRGMYGSVYWGLNSHWSTGVSSEVYGSTYDNTRIEVSGSLGVEYDVFPYKESTRRQLRIQYRLGGAYDDFREKTIYDKYHAWFGYESFSANLSLIQPWGSVSGVVSASHFFHDFSKNRFTIQSNLSLKLFSGVSLTADGYIAWIHDQLSLSAAGATQEEILLQRRQLATNYEYWASFGISYTFGSIYNTIVNPRFGN
jgi:hypothetical protein